MPRVKKPRQRPHDASAAPANWQWRDGKPRWIPSPTLRKAGWKGQDLRDGAGAWLRKGPSIEAAERVNAAVKAWRAGEAADAPNAPDAALAVPARRAAGDDHPHSIGALIDAWVASDAFKAKPHKTQQDRRSKLSRLVDVLAGWPVKPPPAADAKTLAAYAAARAVTRAAMVHVLLPIEGADDDRDDLLVMAYAKLHEKVGHNMAHGVLSVASAWFTWIIKSRRRVALGLNPAKLVDRTTPHGRLRTATWDELRALLAAADAAGMPSIGDAVVLGVDLSWSESDLLAVTWGRVVEGRVRGARGKTKAVLETPLLPALGVARLEVIRARQARQYGEGVTHTHLLVCEATGRKWTQSHFSHKFGEIRAGAALDGCPTVATLNFQDLRDTAVTIAYEAGLTEQEIASRTAHSLQRIRDVLDNHYGKISRQVADNGALKLEAYLGKMGMRL